jgi:YD repeat-containing protein
LTYNYANAYEPYGELASLKKPLGYTTQFLYSASSQGGEDYGLPSDAVGNPMSQSGDTSTPTRTPHQYFTYDANGNLISYNKGNGNWTLTYDALNRMTSHTDPDGVTTRHCYFPDGSKQADQTAEQYSLDGGTVCGPNSVSWSYDLDGNAISETHHYGGFTGTTTKWYDGADRLVEVASPVTASNGGTTTAGFVYTRYKYDLSAGGLVSIENGPSYRAYGGLYVTQRDTNGQSALPVVGWYDYSGSAFDGLDRQVQHFMYPETSTMYFGPQWSTAVPTATTYAYDTDANHLGLLGLQTDALGTQTSKSYDPSSRIQSVAFSDGTTPGRTYSYDEDGRTAGVISALASGTIGSISDVYDADGRKTSDVQANNAGSETLAYSYYPDGMREGLSVSGAISALSLQTYGYRSDGLREAESFSYGSLAAAFGWAYTAQGRMTTFTDPFSSRQMTYDAFGQLATDAFAAGKYTFETRDPEGQPLTFSAYNGTILSGTVTSTAGVTIQYYPDNRVYLERDPANARAQAFEGTNCPAGMCYGPRFDASPGTPPAQAGTPGNDNYYTFDAAGRQTSRMINWSTEETCTSIPSPRDPGGGTTSQCLYNGNWGSARSYDAENHLVGESPRPSGREQFNLFAGCGLQGPFYNADSEPQASVPAPVSEYVYGPTGQIISDSVVGASQIYWDGDDLLYAGGTMYLGDFAAVNTSGSPQLTIFDRDFSGAVVSQHNGTGHDVWYTPAMYLASATAHCPTNLVWTSQYPVASSSSFTRYIPPLWMPRTDGIFDGWNTIQGARAYDMNTGQWTAPDAYQGDPEDPLSQNAYMWNNNNPYSYADPSGYETGAVSTLNAPGVSQCGSACAAAIGEALAVAIRVAPLSVLLLLSGDEPKKEAPPLPSGLVGKNPRKSSGKRYNSGEMTPENGGTGNAEEDFEKLTGGTGVPAPADMGAPQDSLLGGNGVILRPGTVVKGPRIDIPKNGQKPHETLHYPQ